MLSPATLAALHRLIAILLVLIDALAAPVDGQRPRFLKRLAARAFSAYLERLAADLTDRASEPKPTRPRRIPVRHPPSAPTIIRLPSPFLPQTNPLRPKIRHLSDASQHA